MGLFNKFKNLFTNNKTPEIKQEVKEDVEVYDKGLEKSRKEFVSKISLLNLKYKKVSPEYFEELEEILIMADIGVNTVMEFVDKLKKRVKHEHIEDSEDLKEIIVDEMFIIYVNNSIMVNKINYAEEGPTVILFVGVNGVGKTTTIGKLASKLTDEGKKVLLVAGDTFRAGAVEQIVEWGTRTNCPVIYKEDADPASVIFDGVTKAVNENYDVVLIDTAGRLQNKTNLMNELEKINKVIGRIIPGAPNETLLVIDATTGQNGISQAKEFQKITNITGIVLTKLDGTAKGGIVLAIKEELDIPVKYIGLGEGINDLEKSMAFSFSQTIPTFELFLSLLTAIMASIIIVFIYKKTYIGVSYTKSFSLTIILLCMITSLVIKTINSNLSLSSSSDNSASILAHITTTLEPSLSANSFNVFTYFTKKGLSIILEAFFSFNILGIILISEAVAR